VVYATSSLTALSEQISEIVAQRESFAIKDRRRFEGRVPSHCFSSSGNTMAKRVDEPSDFKVARVIIHGSSRMWEVATLD